MDQQRRVAVFTGSVQGVGFRFTACRLAERFDVVGHVRNRSDGAVEVVVEGAPAEIDAFLGALVDDMAGYVRHIDQQTAPARGGMSGFTVKH